MPTSYLQRPTRPGPAIEIDQAVDYIRWHADNLQRHIDGSPTEGLLEEDEKHHHLLVEAARDCGWCIFFQKGDEGLKELAEATVIGTINPYRFELRHLIDHSFNGIGEWHTYGEA